MGRPGLSQNKKFRRLALELKSPAIARGHLELMWDSAYEAGDEVLGDSLDVELAASWKGKPGVLCDLLTRTGFIDESEGTYMVHDFWHHAPEYVAGRRSKEMIRKKPRPCESCGNVFHSSEPHAKFCTPACRTAAYRARHSDAQVTEAPVTVTECDAPPSPSPSPSPLLKEIPPTPSGPGKRVKVKTLGGYPEELDQAMECWRGLRRSLLAEGTLSRFPNDPDGRYVAQVGTKGKAWEAWQKRLGSMTPEGVKVTNAHILGAVQMWADVKLRNATAGRSLSMPNLSSLINSPDFEDALLRVAAPEVAHVV